MVEVTYVRWTKNGKMKELCYDAETKCDGVSPTPNNESSRCRRKDSIYTIERFKLY